MVTINSGSDWFLTIADSFDKCIVRRGLAKLIHNARVGNVWQGVYLICVLFNIYLSAYLSFNFSQCFLIGCFDLISCNKHGNLVITWLIWWGWLLGCELSQFSSLKLSFTIALIFSAPPVRQTRCENTKGGWRVHLQFQRFSQSLPDRRARPSSAAAVLIGSPSSTCH